MKKILLLAIPFVLITKCLQAKDEKTFYCYARYSHDSNANGLVKKSVYNKHHKLVYEKIYGEWDGIKKFYCSYNDTNNYVSETFYHYIQDTLLVLEQRFRPDFRKAISPDTFITVYSYNKQNQLVREMSASYTYHAQGCLVEPNKKWDDTTITTYTYNNKNAIELVFIRDLHPRSPGFAFKEPTNKKVYSYDKKGRIGRIDEYSIPSWNQMSGYPLKLGKENIIPVASTTYNYNINIYTTRYKETNEILGMKENNTYYLDKKNNVYKEDIDELTTRMIRTYKYVPHKQLESEIVYEADSKKQKYMIDYTYR